MDLLNFLDLVNLSCTEKRFINRFTKFSKFSKSVIISTKNQYANQAQNSVVVKGIERLLDN